MDLPPPIARLKTLAIGDGQLVIHGGLASFQEVLSPWSPARSARNLPVHLKNCVR